MISFDTHAHYDYKQFNNDRTQIFKKLKDCVCGVVNIGMNCESLKVILEYAKNYSFFWCSAGIHPQEVSYGYSIYELKKIIEDEMKNSNSKIVAIGETGLDYHFNYPVDLQKKYFLDQIHLANELNLPIVIHARESHKDVLEVLQSNIVKKGGIMHCYSGNVEYAKEFLKLGFYFGFGGPITWDNISNDVINEIPLNRIVIETDAPLLPPLPLKKNERNDSSYLKYVINKIAEIKKMDVNEINRITIENACKVYNICM